MIFTPLHALYFLGIHVAEKAFHAVALDEGGHIVFEGVQIVSQEIAQL